jgi:hypothetical protein
VGHKADAFLIFIVSYIKIIITVTNVNMVAFLVCIVLSIKIVTRGYVIMDPFFPDIRQVEANKVGGACGTHGRGECTRFWWESPKEIDH